MEGLSINKADLDIEYGPGSHATDTQGASLDAYTNQEIIEVVRSMKEKNEQLVAEERELSVYSCLLEDELLRLGFDRLRLQEMKRTARRVQEKSGNENKAQVWATSRWLFEKEDLWELKRLRKGFSSSTRGLASLASRRLRSQKGGWSRLDRGEGSVVRGRTIRSAGASRSNRVKGVQRVIERSRWTQDGRRVRLQKCYSEGTELPRWESNEGSESDAGRCNSKPTLGKIQA